MRAASAGFLLEAEIYAQKAAFILSHYRSLLGKEKSLRDTKQSGCTSRPPQTHPRPNAQHVWVNMLMDNWCSTNLPNSFVAVEAMKADVVLVIN